MTELELIIDLHKDNWRQGPGGEKETRLAIELAGLDRDTPVKIADIGCGTGATTLLLAEELNAQITAVDLFPEFLENLTSRAEERGVADRVTTLVGSMEELPFKDEEYDVIWSEGAVYNMGFEKGVSYWRRFLKPGGTLAVTEITWLTATRPAELHEHWQREYPEVDRASAKMRILESCGYTPGGYFFLPEHCWRENYYRPLREGFASFLERHSGSDEAAGIVEAEEREINLYEKYNSFYSYGFYIGRKLAPNGR